MIPISKTGISFGNLFRIKCSRRSKRYSHEKLKEIIGTHLYNLGWDVRFEFWDEDMDSTYRYDIVAEKDGEYDRSIANTLLLR